MDVQIDKCCCGCGLVVYRKAGAVNHRLDGPAVFHPQKPYYKEFYIDGIQYHEEEYHKHPAVRSYKVRTELEAL